MDFTGAQYVQLTVALAFGILLFVLVYRLPKRSILSVVILLIPFQLVDSRYGSLNTVLIYLVAGAYFLQGRLQRLPLFGFFAMILFAYLLSLAQSHPAARIHHVLFLVNFLTNFLLFYLVYNFIVRSGEYRLILNILVILNFFVIAYCFLQLAAGETRFAFFGIDEFAIIANREDGRLVGPFKATAATADYLSLQSILLVYLIIKGVGKRSKVAMGSLIALNSLFLVTTGNRGGFVVLVAAIPIFLFVFRHELSFVRSVRYLVLGTAIFSIGAAIAVGYTEYGRLFERLEGTEIEGAMPDTRAKAWPRAWMRVQEKPVFGHGPKLWITSRTKQVADIPYVQYPHTLPLHILYTVGIVGLIPWLMFFWVLGSHLNRAKNIRHDDSLLEGIPRLGMVVFIAFLIGQIRIEFLRDGLIDFQNYMFVWFALALACSDKLIVESDKTARVTSFGRSGAKLNTS